MYLKNRFKDYVSDWIQWGMTLMAIIVGVCSFFVKDTSGHQMLDTIRFYFYCFFPIVIFLFGRNGIFFYFTIYAYVIIYYHDYSDFISFIIICMFCFIKPKFKHPALFLYGINTVVVCQLHGKNIMHFVIHTLCCITIYIVMYMFIDNKLSRKTLQLDKDQILILNHLADGYQQKEIDEFSKNTVTKKIHNAMKVNNCATKEELLSLFIMQRNKKDQR